MAHRRLADEILDSIADTQEKFNATMDKLDADTAAALDTDYESTGAITDIFEADDEGTDAQHKRTLRETMRSAFSHKKLADEVADAMEEMQTAYNAMLVKLDAEGGTLNDTDYESSLAVTTIDSDGEGSEAQHKRSLRATMRSALSHRSLADDIMDAISGVQDAMRDSLAALDAGSVNGAHAGFKVTVLDADV
jgi:uncharacterized protein with von Willebrand factor type A (vWA) domain